MCLEAYALWMHVDLHPFLPLWTADWMWSGRGLKALALESN